MSSPKNKADKRRARDRRRALRRQSRAITALEQELEQLRGEIRHLGYRIHCLEQGTPYNP
jgi:predicted RNase H-like nuclease (RuvC/YqgF family)